MKIVFIGDVVGKNGCEALSKELRKIKSDFGAELVIVNGENSAEGNGIDKRSEAAIFDAGADVITTGNHAFNKYEIFEEFDRCDRLIRPANFGTEIAGKGFCELDFGGFKVCVVNLIGSAFMQPCDNPFKCAEELLKGIDAKVIIVDFHAEATSEKRAMGFFLAGKVTAVLGTHTHVQTADEQIIDGTGYITDVGMTGPADSVLGVDKDIIIEKFLTYRHKKHVFASGECLISGVCLDIDVKSGKCVSIERFCRRT